MKSLIVLLSFLVSAPALAQEIHGHGNHISEGGFGGPMVRFTEMNGQFAVIGGGHGGWVVDPHFVLGGGAYALMGSSIVVPLGAPNVPTHLSFVYGGLEMQYLDHPADPVHFMISALVGGGSGWYRSGNSHPNDGVFVTEPGIVFTFHLTRAIHFNVGGTYRFVIGVDLPGLADINLSGFGGTLGVDFGHF